MIIGISGYAQTGKDTVADYLIEKYGFVKVSFADPIREALYRLDPSINIGEFSSASLASAVDHMGWEEVKRLSTEARTLLQRFGTEVGREMFGKDFWVNQALLRAKEHDHVVIPDVRFGNERDAIYRNGGFVWRVVRNGVGPVNSHISDNALSNDDFDFKLYNNGSMEDLFKTVDNRIGF